MKEMAYYCPNCRPKEITSKYIYGTEVCKCKNLFERVNIGLHKGFANPYNDMRLRGGCFEDYINCYFCKTELIRTDMPDKDYMNVISIAITYLAKHGVISEDDAIPLLDEMIDLASNNPREYRRKYKMYKNIRKQDLTEFAEELREQKQEMLEKADSKCVPKCPTCGSTNIQKIGTGEKFVSGAFWGLLSTKIHKTFKCKHCDYMW